MIYILLVALVLLFCFMLLFDKDVFSPACLICESYVLAVMCAIMNIDLWGIDLSSSTIKIIIIGVLAFIIPSSIFLHTYVNKVMKKSKEEVIQNGTPFLLRKSIYLFFVMVQLITLVLYFYYVVKTVGGIGNAFNISNIMNQYREGTSYGDLDSLIPAYVNQLVKISQIIAYISIYNILYKKMILKEKNNIVFLNATSIVLYLLLTLLSGGRYKMISFFIGGLIMWNIINKKISNKKFNFKNTLKITIIVLSILLIFSQTRTLVGRTNKQGFISYISTYFGGSIELLDLYMKSPIQDSNIIGKESFYAINSTLSKFGIVKPYRMHLEFRSSNGIVIGNVYTALRCFYYDFGIIGVIVLQMILSLIWTKWYKKINNNNDIYKFDTSLLFYCMFVNCLFFNSYRDNFFSSTISISTLTMVFYFIIIKKLLVTQSIKER